MREIKFRLIRNNKIIGEEAIIDGKWKWQVYDCNPIDGVRWVPGVYDIYDPLLEYSKYAVERVQYTNSKDKHGKEIYEGDDVKSNDYNPSVMKVEFIEGGFALTAKGISPIDICHFYPSGGCMIEVI